MLLRRTLADAGLSTYTAKNNYQRKRAFMVNEKPICTPEEAEGLRKDGSYPSGHTAIGWAWALILSEIAPERADAILAEYLVNYKESTCSNYRSCLRGFLNYLFHERKLTPINLAPLIVGAPRFSKAKPPCFLRPHELRRLFAGLKLSSASDLRTYAMVHLAYTLGLWGTLNTSIRLIT